MLYSLKEVTIIPAGISNIHSRSECNTLYENGNLPLFTAPMSAVVGVNSVDEYIKNKINPIIPRNVSIFKRLLLVSEENYFVSFSLNEITDNFILNKDSNKKQFHADKEYKILIDVANGNMSRIFYVVKKLKSIYKNVIIMAGNIANPQTYYQYCEAGIDYVRIGIGGGSGCLTSTNTGIHYPMGSLLKECQKIKLTHDRPTKIIADGGIKGYSDVIKALALGADYVMCGSIFTKMEESEAEIIESRGNKHKVFYGMSTPQAQIELGGNGKKATEGITLYLPIEYTMKDWVFNFESYLKSAMSYCNKVTLEEFVGNVTTNVMTNSSIDSINKPYK